MNYAWMPKRQRRVIWWTVIVVCLSPDLLSLLP